MRRQARRFPFEMFFFAFFAFLSIFALLVGSYTAFSGSPIFFLAYANLIGVSMVLVMGALLMFPELLGDMSEAARRFGVGFSRYVRGHRIAEAKRLLAEDARSSVLAISMMTGFRSQSAFYAAFHEIEGEAPGQYRRKLGGA